MSKAVAIILPHLGPSQLAEEVIEAISVGKDKYTLYYENIYPPYRHLSFPYMNVSECLYFSGRIIGTTLSSTKYIQASLQHIEPIMYCYDMEWLRGKTDFIENLKVYRDPNIRLITRSIEYQRLLENYTNRKVDVCSIGDLINAS